MYRDQFGVELICRNLAATEGGFITSRGYRAAKTRPACDLRDEALIPEIRRVHAAPAPVDIVKQLAQLGSLHTSGILTDEEFAATKGRILST